MKLFLRLAVLVGTCLAPLVARGQAIDFAYPSQVAPQDLILIHGSGFGYAKGSARLFPASGSGAKVTLDIETWSDDLIQARLPGKKILPKDYHVAVKKKGGQFTTSTVAVALMAPQIDKVNTEAACLGFIAIEGSWFGHSPKVAMSDGPKKIKGMKVVRVESIASSTIPKQRIVLRLPEKTPGLYEMAVKTNSGTSKYVSYGAPDAKKIGSPEFQVSGGNVAVTGDVASIFPAAILNLGFDRMEISGPANGGQAGFTLAIPGFKPCAYGTTYVVNGADGSLAFNAATQSGSITIAPGFPGVLQVTITDIAGGQVAGEIKGWATHLDMSVKPPVKSSKNVTGSFLVNVFDVEYTGS